MRRGRGPAVTKESDKHYAQQQAAAAFLGEHVTVYRAVAHKELIENIAERLLRFDAMVNSMRQGRPQQLLEDFGIDEPFPAVGGSSASHFILGDNNNNNNNTNHKNKNSSIVSVLPSSSSPSAAAAATTAGAGFRIPSLHLNQQQQHHENDDDNDEDKKSAAKNHTANLSRYLKASVGTLREGTIAGDGGSKKKSKTLGAAAASAAASAPTGLDAATVVVVNVTNGGGNSSSSSSSSATVVATRQGSSPSIVMSKQEKQQPGQQPKAFRKKGSASTVPAAIARTKLVAWKMPAVMQPLVAQLLTNSQTLTREAVSLITVFQELATYVLLSQQSMSKKARTAADVATRKVGNIVCENCNMMVNNLSKVAAHRSDILATLGRIESKMSLIPVHLVPTTNAGVAQMLLTSWDTVCKGFTTLRRLCCLMHNLCSKNWSYLEKLLEPPPEEDMNHQANSEAAASLRRRKK